MILNQYIVELATGLIIIGNVAAICWPTLRLHRSLSREVQPSRRRDVTLSTSPAREYLSQHLQCPKRSLGLWAFLAGFSFVATVFLMAYALFAGVPGEEWLVPCAFLVGLWSLSGISVAHTFCYLFSIVSCLRNKEISGYWLPVILLSAAAAPPLLVALVLMPPLLLGKDDSVILGIVALVWFLVWILTSVWSLTFLPFNCYERLVDEYPWREE